MHQRSHLFSFLYVRIFVDEIFLCSSNGTTLVINTILCTYNIYYLLYQLHFTIGDNKFIWKKDIIAGLQNNFNAFGVIDKITLY